MPKKTLVFVLATASLFAIVNTRPTSAELIVTEEQIAAIKQNCVNNQAALNQLHQTDAFLRIDRGNLYRTISDKLMVPLNRRMASNQLDAGALVSTTAQFNKEYSTFYKAYIEYDRKISRLLSIDCTKEPVTFYNALLAAREARSALYDSNKRLVQLATVYKQQFDAFRVEFLNPTEAAQ